MAERKNMAHICSCIYCNRQNVNKKWCPDCRNAFCEGVLGQIKKLLKRKKIKGLPRCLVRIILAQDFDNLEKLEQRRRKAITRATKKQLHDLLRARIAQDFLRKWDEKHPDQDPLTFP